MHRAHSTHLFCLQCGSFKDNAVSKPSFDARASSSFPSGVNRSPSCCIVQVYLRRYFLTSLLRNNHSMAFFPFSTIDSLLCPFTRKCWSCYFKPGSLAIWWDMTCKDTTSSSLGEKGGDRQCLVVVPQTAGIVSCLRRRAPFWSPGGLTLALTGRRWRKTKHDLREWKICKGEGIKQLCWGHMPAP